MAQAPRRRTTRPSTRLAEGLIHGLISVGGLTTVAAVLLLFAFLLWTVVPLFATPRVGPEQALASAPALPDAALLHLAVDEAGLLGAAFLADGSVEVRRLEDGALVERRQPFDGVPTAWAFDPGGELAVVGFEDGSLRRLSLGFAVAFLTAERVAATPALAALEPGASLPHEGGLVRATEAGRHRRDALRLEVDEPILLDGGRPVRRLDLASGGRRERFVALDDGGGLHLVQATRRRNLLTDTVSVSLDAVPLPYAPRTAGPPPRDLFLLGQGGGLLLLWEDGGLRRLDLADLRRPRVVEERALLERPAGRVSAARLLPGRQTLLVADDSGRLAAWFMTRPEDAGTADGGVMRAGHELLPAGGPVPDRLAVAARSRLVAVGLADGQVLLLHATTEQRLGALSAEAGDHLAWLPRGDGLLALGSGGLRRWSLDAEHAEVTLATLFRPVWYEGYDAPRHEWQSTSGRDGSEPKLGFAPLLFGTLKATLWSMLLGAPLALLAAVFTSEFLRRRVRAPVKTTVELMASLPSVVLGYLAGVVVAPFAAGMVPSLMAGLLAIPACLVLGAHLWRLLPVGLSARLAGAPRLAVVAGCLALGLVLARSGGPWLERVAFAGDLILWLDGQRGSGFGGWVVLLLPLAALGVTWGTLRWWGPWWRARLGQRSRALRAWLDLLLCLLGLVLTLALSLALAGLLTLLGLDPRGSLMGTFEARNALVVGFVMGFAIIPVIYTLAEDALASVPEHLRLASLGTGATTWQTAVRVVIPTALSGLFSAVMIGLGRAVGETMIVLMATGNTAVLDWNVFNGFRTLSANIAVELPEAAPGTTHYRTLFLAALVLFVLTFLLNTLAELVRSRFRRRALEL